MYFRTAPESNMWLFKRTFLDTDLINVDSRVRLVSFHVHGQSMKMLQLNWIQRKGKKLFGKLVTQPCKLVDDSLLGSFFAENSYETSSVFQKHYSQNISEISSSFPETCQLISYPNSSTHFHRFRRWRTHTSGPSTSVSWPLSSWYHILIVSHSAHYFRIALWPIEYHLGIHSGIGNRCELGQLHTGYVDIGPNVGIDNDFII